jgi:hypothetical protein
MVAAIHTFTIHNFPGLMDEKSRPSAKSRALHGSQRFRPSRLARAAAPLILSPSSAAALWPIAAQSPAKVGHAAIDLLEFLLVADKRGGKQVGVNGEWHEQQLYARDRLVAPATDRAIGIRGLGGHRWRTSLPETVSGMNSAAMFSWPSPPTTAPQ